MQFFKAVTILVVGTLFQGAVAVPVNSTEIDVNAGDDTCCKDNDPIDPHAHTCRGAAPFKIGHTCDEDPHLYSFIGCSDDCNGRVMCDGRTWKLLEYCGTAKGCHLSAAKGKASC